MNEEEKELFQIGWLVIYEQIESPEAASVKERLAEWRAEI